MNEKGRQDRGPGKRIFYHENTPKHELVSLTICYLSSPGASQRASLVNR